MKDPRGVKRPKDVVANAITVAKTATGELKDKPKKRVKKPKKD